MVHKDQDHLIIHTVPHPSTLKEGSSITVLACVEEEGLRRIVVRYDCGYYTLSKLLETDCRMMTVDVIVCGV